MSFLLALIGIPIFLYLSFKVFNDPLWGILIVLLLRPIEPLLGLESIQLGRLMGVLAFLIWFVYLHRSPGAMQRLRKSPLTLFISILMSFLFLATFSWFSADGFEKAIDGFISVLLLGMLALMLENVITSKERLKMLLFVFSISGSLAALPAAAYMVGFDLYSVLGVDAPTTRNEDLEIVRAGAIGGGANTLGILARIGVFSSLLYLLFDKAKNMLVYILLIISLLGLVISASRTNFYGILIAIALFIGFVFLYSRGNGIRVFITVLVIGFVGYGAYSLAPSGTKNRLINTEESDYADDRFDQRNDFRKVQQQEAIELFWRYPLTGGGFYRSNLELDRYHVSHDTFSVIVGETGLFGIIPSLIFFAGYFSLMFKSLNASDTSKRVRLYLSALLSIFIALLVMGFFGGLIFLYDRSFWIFVGISFATLNLNKSGLI